MWNVLVLVSSLLISSPLAAGKIRLSGHGSTKCSGRVEVYHGGSWGTVCDDDWDENDAAVVCRQLSCGTALSAPGSASFGQGTGQIWLDNVKCSGRESSLTACGHRGFGTHDCSHSEDAGVVCSGQIRLSGPGSTKCSGRVEIYHNKNWGTVCDDSWGVTDAEVVCRQLSCGTALHATSSKLFGEGTGQIWLDEVACSGSESSLLNCQHRGFGTHDCSHSEDAGVICSESLPKPSISMYPAGEVTWSQDISITCTISTELLGGAFILEKTSGSFRQTQTPGSNSATFNIPKVNFDHHGSYRCRYEKSISSQTFTSSLSDSVTIIVIVKLPKPSISMNPAGEVTWGQKVGITCSISTQALGGTFILTKTISSFRKTQRSSTDSVTFWIDKADFIDEGSYQCQYKTRGSNRDFSSPLSDPLRLSITVRLPRPEISLTSPNSEMVWGPEVAVVTRGSSFTFTCSINSRNSQGQFFLISSGSNIMYSEPAINNSASFNFPAAGNEHQGNYSCVYELTLSTRRFNSTEAAPITVVIELSVLLLVSSISSGVLLLSLLVFMVVCLVRRRRPNNQPPTTLSQIQTADREWNHYDKDDEDDGEDYENVDLVDMTMKLRKKETEEESDGYEKPVSDEDHDYVEAGPNSNGANAQQIHVSVEDNSEEDYDEESSDEDDDYVNVTPPCEQSVEIYQSYEDIYQNF